MAAAQATALLVTALLEIKGQATVQAIAKDHVPAIELLVKDQHPAELPESVHHRVDLLDLEEQLELAVL